MDIKLLHTFLVVAKLRNITQAANELSYAQPTVTSQIQALEEHFGVLLFKRVGKKLYITEAGQAFIGYAEKVVNSFCEAEAAMHEFDDSGNVIKIGLATMAATYLLSPALVEFQNQTDSLVSVEICPTVPVTIKGLLEDKFDLAIVHDRLSDRRFIQFDIATEKLAWVAQRQLVEKHDHDLDVESYPFITYKKGAVYRAKYEPYLKEKHIHPFMVYNDSEAIKRAVLDGVGTGVLPKVIVEQYIENGMLIELEDVPDLNVTLSIALRANKQISPSLRTLLGIFSHQLSSSDRLTEFLQHNQ